MSPEAFCEEMEERFGSDEALGLHFLLDEDGSTLTLDEFEQNRRASCDYTACFL